MTFVLRSAEPADSETVAAIWHAGWGDGHLGNVPDQLVTARTRDAFSRRASDRIPDTTIGENDGSPAGFVVVIGDEIEQVYVSAEHRGRGLAGLLLAEAERQIATAGHQQAWLAVATGNSRARRAYEHHGWTDAGAFDYPADTDNGPVPVSCHRYVKDLGSGSC